MVVPHELSDTRSIIRIRSLALLNVYDLIRLTITDLIWLIIYDLIQLIFSNLIWLTIYDLIRLIVSNLIQLTGFNWIWLSFFIWFDSRLPYLFLNQVKPFESHPR